MSPTDGESRPTSFEAMDWSEPAAPPETQQSGSAPDPPSTELSTEQSAPVAETAPGETPPGEATMAPSPDGFIPLDRHKSALNAAYKERDESRDKLSRLQWAESLANSGKSAEQIQEALSLYDGIDGDPAGFLERFYANLESHPTFGTQVRSWAGRVLNGQRALNGQPGPNSDPEPQPDRQDAEGGLYYTAPQMQKLLAWKQRQFEAQIDERYAPVLEAHRRQAEVEAVNQQVRTLAEQQRQVLTELQQDPVFKEYEQDVRAYMKSKNFMGVTLHSAYAHVLATKAIPSLKATGQSQAEAAMRTQAAASGLKPSTTAPVMPGKRPKSFHDDRLKWE